ncbi:MAG: hypothetical protein ACYS7Y_34165 [Planctomycetota bacterium]
MPEDIDNGFLGGIRLANGRNLEDSRNPEELEWFFKTGGTSITEPKRSKGGKSKGARGRGKRTARQPREER